MNSPSLPEKIAVDVSATRNYEPFGMLLHAARCLGEMGRSGTQGSGWANVGALVLLAFAVEAFCQQYGKPLFPDTWDGKGGVEKMPVVDKVKLIGRKAGVAVDYGMHPWKDIKALMAVRDSLAHAKPSEDQETMRLLLDDEEQASVYATNLIRQPWEVMSSSDRAPVVEANVRAGIETLLVGLGYDKFEMETMGSGSYVMSAASPSQQ